MGIPPDKTAFFAAKLLQFSSDYECEWLSAVLTESLALRIV